MKIVAGGNHTLLLLDEGIRNGDDMVGTLYYAGIQRDGSVQPRSLGIPQSKITFQKAHVSASGHQIRNCSAFWEGSVFVNMENEIYTTGLGSKGELGLGENEAGKGICDSEGLRILQEFPPDRDLGMSQVVDVASGVDHTVVVLQSGWVWGWGNGRKGQIYAPGGLAGHHRSSYRDCQVMQRNVQCVDGNSPFYYMVVGDVKPWARTSMESSHKPQPIFPTGKT